MKFNINGLEWQLLSTEPNSDELKLDDDSGATNIGLTDYKNLEMYVDNSLNEQVLKRTIIHEVTHAYLFSYGFDALMSEEELCDFISSNAQNILNLSNSLYKRYINY